MSSLHRELERRIAKLKGKEDALLFASGYQANVGLLDGLLREGDAIVYDELSHASLYDGLRLVRARMKFLALRFRHNDIGHLQAQLEKLRAAATRTGQIFVAVEGVYSMDGDIARLPEIGRLCSEYDACLIVDDAARASSARMARAHRIISGSARRSAWRWAPSARRWA
jgi:7-keto-8-aminopelargonate synthetase-like enzyme